MRDTTQIDNEILLQEEKTKIARAQATEYKKSLENMKWVEKVDRVSTEDLGTATERYWNTTKPLTNQNTKSQQQKKRWTPKTRTPENTIRTKRRRMIPRDSNTSTWSDRNIYWYNRDPTKDRGTQTEINQKASQQRDTKNSKSNNSKEVELTKQATILDDLREKEKKW